MTSLAWTPPQVRENWRWPAVVTVSLVMLLLWGYRETAAAMVGIWIRSGTFTHAFVVPPIVAWLIWRKRGELERLQPRPLPWVLLPMLSLAVMWWLGQLANVAAAMQLAMVAMLVATVPLVLGWQVTRVLAFPLAFTLFAVPIGEFLTPTLMYWTAEALVAGLRFTGIPVYQEGQHLVIPSGRWAVAAACSGIRYLMATFMVGSLFAYLNFRSTRKQLIFVAISIVLPVIANWLRAYIIVMLGHLSNNEIATGVDHLVYGWVFFGVVILGLFFIGARWADRDESIGTAASASLQPDGIAAHLMPSARMVVVALLGLFATCWPLWMQDAGEEVAAGAPVQFELPDALGNWAVVPRQQEDWTPGFPTATVKQAKTYASTGGQVTIHVSYYRGQGGEVKLVGSENRFVESGDKRWHVLSEGRALTSIDGHDITWRRATVLATDSDGRSSSTRPQLTVWRLYWIGGRLAHNDVHAKLLQAWLAARGEPDDGAAIHLVSSLPDAEAAERQLAAFVSENFHMLDRSLTAARDQR